MESPTPLGHAVREALRSADISQRAAADRTGIRLSTLNRRLSGAQPFRVNELAAIADLLGVTVADLVARANPIHPDDPDLTKAGGAA